MSTYNRRDIDMEQLKIEVGEWASRNFEEHNPLLGIIEEVGELAHCFLKRSQKIRGFDNPKIFEEHTKDAIGDIGIYAAHFAYIYNLRFNLDEIQDLHIRNYMVERKSKTNLNHAILSLIFNITQIDPDKGFIPIGDQPYHDIQASFGFVLWNVINIAFSEGFDTVSIVVDTWESVRQRDWKANQHTGTRISLPEAPPPDPSTQMKMDWGSSYGQQ
jgi:NTP pyrophosphatase (non-canonical NTP hydrolase)